MPYTKALLAATPPNMLVDPEKGKPLEGLTPEQVAKMEKEMEVLQRDLQAVQQTHGNEMLELVLASGYVTRLFSNPRVARYLAQHHEDLCRELHAIVEGSSLEN